MFQGQLVNVMLELIHFWGGPRNVVQLLCFVLVVF